MDMNKAIPSPSDASVTSKVASFTPLRFAQISNNQELPVPPNQLLLNGKVPLDLSLYNDGSYPALKPHYGYPVSLLPSLNCLPEKTISMGVSKAMPLPSDTVVASKVTSFTPLMFAQFSDGQELTVPPNQFPLSGKLSLNPVLCNGSNGLAPKPQYGYPISVLPNLNSLPEKTVGMDASKAMPLPSTPMIVEKKRFVQDRLPREVIDLVDESLSKEDKQEKRKWQPLVYNQAEPNILKPTVSYSSEHLVPSQIVSFQQQMVDRAIVQEEIGTWQSTLQKQMDLCFLKPTAKSSAFLSAVPSEIAFSFEPTVQSPCEHVMTSQTISSLKQMAEKGDMQEKEVQKCQHIAQNQVELCFSNSVGSSSLEPRVPSQVASSQQKQSEVNAIISPEVASSQQKQSEVSAIISSGEVPGQELDAEKQSENQRIDLNKTPQQKPKRKKHRPKVIREDKPARTPKPKTPKPVTPKRAKNKEENPSGKRKYVRKKKVQNSPDNPTDALREIVNPNNASGTKSVRRCLNFDSENLQARNGCLVSASTLTCNAESQAQKKCIAGPSTRSSTNSTLHHCQGPEVVVGSSPTVITLDLNNSMNQMLNEFVNLAENPAPPLQPCRTEMMGTSQLLDGYRRMPENRIISSRPSKRELIRKNLNELAQKNEYLKISANPERSLETGQSRPDLHKISDVMLKSTKRDHKLVDDAHFSASINVTHASNGIDGVSECHNTGSNDPYFSKNCKKRRIENEQNGQNGLTSSAASMTYKPLNNLRTNQVVPNNSEVFTFADAQRFMVPEKQRPSECMLSFDQAESNIRPTFPVQAHNSTSVSATMDCNYRSTPVKQSGYSNADCTHTTTPVKQSGQNHVDYNQPPTPGKPLGGNDSQESEICKPQPCMEDIVINTNARTKPKNRAKKKQDHLVNPESLKTNRTCLQEHEAAAFNSGSSPGQKAPQATALASGYSRERKSLLQIGSSLDCQSSSNFNESLNGSGTIGAVVPYGDPLDDIIQKLKYLNINRWHDGAPTQTQNALVPYDGRGGVMVPYVSLLDIARKRRPRAKVDLDPETNRVWKLLMGKEASHEGMDMDKEKWWEEERRVFCGRVDSFIARMHLVQGDRRFSQWKGSVVDSVVGVFLTQNVSDHLSSSAFMALAARFPLKSRDNDRRPGAEKTNTSGEQQDRCMSASENATKWQESMLHKELNDQDSVVIIGEKERANSHESYGSNTGGAIADYSKDKCLGAHQRELEIGHESPDSRSDTPATITGSTSLAEVKDKRSVEDVVSSQNSVVSSQYSSEYQVQTADQNGSSPFSNFEAEELIIGSACNGMDSSTSFTELLRIAELGTHGNERIPSADYCGAMDRFAQLDVDKRYTVLNQYEKLKGVLPSMHTSDSYFHNTECDILRVSCAPFVPYNFNNSRNSGLVGMNNANVVRDESGCPHSSTTSGSMNTNKINFMDILCGPLANNAIEDIGQQKLSITSEAPPSFDSYAQISKQHVQPLTGSETEDYVRKCSNNNNPRERTGASLGKSVSHQCSFMQHECTEKLQRKEKEANFQVENTQHAVKVPSQKQNSQIQQIYPDLQNNQRKALETVEGVESNFKDESHNFQKVSSETANNGLKAKKTKVESEKKNTYHWDSLRKEVYCKGANKERSHETMDSLDWEAIRRADVKEISETIRERGMNNMLAERIKEFLNRLVRDHGSIDLEWLRDVEPDKAKDYLLSIRGLGLKSVECVRLLTLHHLAFPVDTNVGRICVRLGWVPLQPLPESLQLHLLELYPMLETIQKYLWPRLCKLDQRTLYELHYQMITFGKVFCTKSKPNCNACPMRGECKHFASAFASARLALPGPEEKSLMSSTIPITSENCRSPSCNFPLPQLEVGTSLQERTIFNNCEPIIEEPATPEAECLETEESAIEDAFFEDPDEIPTIKLNFEEFTQNLQNYMQVHNTDIQDGDMSKALVAITPEVASIPMPKLKNVSRLRTEHQVYELPDSHPLLEGLDRREPDDPCSYLLAIWTPGETAQSTEPPKAFCDSQETGKLCDRKICFACNSIREAQAQTVRGTILIPCRTAMRGSFPLNGTYFQVNEVFADHDTSRNPIDVPRQWIWNLPRRTVYFGTSMPTIFKGLTTEVIQQCFWRGFVCVRGFDRITRAPKPLYARLHFPASKAPKNKKAAAAAARDE
ncbi:protein ROS1A isoform X1 [Phoenix dactylifera]|uniref:Protein ROS1A isoform X1 n=1 Tax=Phoenix dactylifera TaxID=42345 RepID=A0A8B7CVJ9_PHODC|nr:protein ROS1A isoform X1 [Phoenix dactylifera]XP_008807512.2 protein ROS1A isoform X1 [Phoenix dactylifera]